MVLGHKISTMGTRLKQFAGFSSDDPPSDVPPVLDWTGFDGSLEGAEVIGRSPMSYIAASESVSTMMGKQTSRTLASDGLEEIEPDEWYSLNIPLAMLYKIRDAYGGASMQNMGRHIPQHVEFPPELSGVEAALQSIDQAYNQNHRGGDIGSYEFQKEGPGEGTMICENVYPCELDQGLIQGVAREFAESPVTVDEVGDQCRSEGGHRCEYSVNWVSL